MDATHIQGYDLLLAIGAARGELGELVAVTDDPRDLQTRGCRAPASALLCRLTVARQPSSPDCAASAPQESPAGSRPAIGAARCTRSALSRARDRSREMRVLA